MPFTQEDLVPLIKLYITSERGTGTGWQQKIELAQQHTAQNKINIAQKYN